MTVLVVDDESLTRQILVRYITDLGYETVEAKDGEEAIRALAAGTFDAMFLDIFMPVRDGFEVLAWLREQGLTEMPVIVFSEANVRFNVDFQEMAERLGALRAYDKPVTLEKVRVALGEAAAINTAARRGGRL
ncbi:MAG: response regulator [Rhodospirillales bacterium]